MAPKPKYSPEELDKIAEMIKPYYLSHPHKVTIESFFADNNIAQRAVMKQIDRHEGISDAIDWIRSITADRCVELCKDKILPPAMAIFILKNKGYSDRTVLEQTTTVIESSLSKLFSQQPLKVISAEDADIIEDEAANG